MRLSKIIIVLLIGSLFLSEPLAFFHKGLSGVLKLGTYFGMLLFSILTLKYSKKLLFFIGAAILLLLANINNGFSAAAGVEEGVRYLFPIITLLFGYAIRKNLALLISLFVVFAVINNLWQLVNYFNWWLDIPQWFYHRYHNGAIVLIPESAGVLRATGLLGFFGAFGFLNFVSFFLVRFYYHKKYKKVLLVLFGVGVFLSLSMKLMGVFVITLLLSGGLTRFVKVSTVGVLITFIFISFNPHRTRLLLRELDRKISFYITEGNSARSESYRVMYNEIVNGNLLGRGVGVFGGPSSTKYNSPFYEAVNFNWHSMSFLKTTDTFYPHLFVELGIVGGVIFILMIISPVFKWKFSRRELTVLGILYFVLLFDSIFAFSLKNPSLLLCSLLFVYPIIHYETKVRRLKEKLN